MAFVSYDTLAKLIIADSVTDVGAFCMSQLQPFGELDNPGLVD